MPSSSMSRRSRAIRQAEVGAARTMIERTAGSLRPLARAARRRQRLWLGRDARLAGPRARDRAAHPGVRQVRAHATAPSSRADFTYDHERDAYICPAGKELRQRQKIYRTPRPLVDDERHDALPRQQARLRRLRAEAALLPEHAGPQDPALDPRRRPRHGARHRRPPTPMSPRGASGRRSRCCSPTSSAS